MFSSIIVFWLLKYSVTFDKDKDKDHSFHPSLSPSDSLNFLDKLSTEMSPSLSHPLCLTLSSAQSLPLPGVQAYILKHGLCQHGPRPLPAWPQASVPQSLTHVCPTRNPTHSRFRSEYAHHYANWIHSPTLPL